MEAEVHCASNPEIGGPLTRTCEDVADTPGRGTCAEACEPDRLPVKTDRGELLLLARGGSGVERLFVLARHGESVLNRRRIVNGDPRRPAALTRRGEEQAQLLGDQIRNLPIALAVCTRFPRTRQTAEIALAARDVPIVVEPGLDDIDVGELDGHSVNEFRSWKRAHRWSDPFPSGESLCETVRRYAVAFRSLLRRPEATILVVCHAAPIRYLLDSAIGMIPLADSRRLVANATPYMFTADALAFATEGLEKLVSPAGTKRPAERAALEVTA